MVCDETQGYLLSTPLQVEVLEEKVLNPVNRRSKARNNRPEKAGRG
jgi:hypothetical protein